MVKLIFCLHVSEDGGAGVRCAESYGIMVCKSEVVRKARHSKVSLRRVQLFVSFPFLYKFRAVLAYCPK